jgi:hypothetical protein
MSEPRWIRFEEQPTSAVRRTRIWLVFTKDDDICLGGVEWYASWRKYVFQPTGFVPVVFEERCLRDVADFVEARTREHKAARAAEGEKT